MTESAFRIVVTEQLNESGLARLEAAGEVVRLDACDEAALLAAAVEADALVIRTYSKITAKVLAVAKEAGRLKVIGRAGVGVDNIDLAAAAEAGIAIVHTPAACTHAVADLTVGLILAVQREIVRCDAGVRDGQFKTLRAGMPKSCELQHQTLGVIGMGRIGQAVGQRLGNGFGMRVIYHDIREIGWLPFVATSMPSAEAVYAEADVVTLHVPLTTLTRKMIDARALKCFKAGGYLINTSRGPAVDTQALAEALKSGQLGGAAIDVHDPEPPPPDSPLRDAPNCVLSPHMGARSQEGIAAMNDVVDDVIGVLNGKEPVWPAGSELSGGIES